MERPTTGFAKSPNRSSSCALGPPELAPGARSLNVSSPSESPAGSNSSSRSAKSKSPGVPDGEWDGSGGCGGDVNSSRSHRVWGFDVAADLEMDAEMDGELDLVTGGGDENSERPQSSLSVVLSLRSELEGVTCALSNAKSNMFGIDTDVVSFVALVD
jgi:hypothetical protein